MNVVSQTITYLDLKNGRVGKYPIGEVYEAQQEAIDWARNQPGYWEGYDDTLAELGLTRSQWGDPHYHIDDSEVFWKTFYAIEKYNRSRKVFIRAGLRNYLCCLARNAANRGAVKREKNGKGRWIYFN